MRTGKSRPLETPSSQKDHITSSLIATIDPASPVAQAMLGLLPHCTPPVVLPPAPGVPPGCLHLPMVNLAIIGTDGLFARSWDAAEAIGRSLGSDVVIVGCRPNGGRPTIRYDVMFVQSDRVELIADLVFWTLPGHMPGFVPKTGAGPAVMIGRTTLIPTETLPFHTPADRAAGIARGLIGGRGNLAGIKCRRSADGEERCP